LEWYDNLSRLLFNPEDAGKGETLVLHVGRANEKLEQALVELYSTVLLQLIRLACHPPDDDSSHKPGKYDYFRTQILEKESAVVEALDTYDIKAQLRKLITSTDEQRPASTQNSGRATGEGSHSPELNIPPKDLFDLPKIRNDVAGVVNFDADGNGPVRNAAYQWVRTAPEYADYTDWTANKSQVLCITGAPGSGKSLVLTSIVQNLSKDQQQAPEPKTLAFFIPENSRPKPKNAASVVQGLVWQLLIRQPSLSKHWSRAIEATSRDQFDRPIDFYAVSGILYSLLQHVKFESTYFVVDAIDESFVDGSEKEVQGGLQDLMQLIFTTTKMSTKVKWLISVDSALFFEKIVAKTINQRWLRFDLDRLINPMLSVARAYVSSRVDQLMQRTRKNDEFRAHLIARLEERSEGNLLWITLACKIIESEQSPWNAPSTLERLPVGLVDLYHHAYRSLNRLSDAERAYCHELLSTAACAYRPLHITELEDVTNIPTEVNLRLIVKKCSPFLELKDDIVFFVHHSTQSFLRGNEESQRITHAKITRSCLDFLCDSFDVVLGGKPAVREHNIDGRQEEQPVHYATSYWMKHVWEVSGVEDNYTIISTIIRLLNDHLFQWLETFTSSLGLSYLIREIRHLEALFTVRMTSISILLIMLQ
jgi:hypothetical protein